MKIEVHAQQKNISISIPTKMIFNRFALRTVTKHIPVGESTMELSSEAASKLVRELDRIRKQRGSWVLVEVDSAGGEHVTITI